MEAPSRLGSLVLVDGAGTVAGRLPALRVETPWWQDTDPWSVRRASGSVSAFLDRIPAVSREIVEAHWNEAWRAVAPEADPGRAAALLAPVAAAR